MNNDLINTIRSKVDIIDIIGDRIPLVSKGKNYFGICPFHEDSNPSLCVSRDKQIYTCFSCHATGNVYTFLMEYEHINFQEALVYLGELVGVDVSSFSVPKKNNKYSKFYEAYSFSVKYFQNNLSSSLGRKAREYLISRGIDESVIKEFEIGLSLDQKDDLTQLLLQKQFDIVNLNLIGLSFDDRDIYCNRVMFPLYDLTGKVVAFSGRIYENSDQSKYINTKETPLFKKGELLYHYHIAREECRSQNSVIVMEGFMDVIRASTIGVRNTVALMGTALTSEQISLIKRLSPHIIFCLDGDDAGVHATIRNGELFFQHGIEIKVIRLPKEDDPDTFIFQQGKDKFLSLIDSCIPFQEFKLNQLKEQVNFQDDVEKSEYIHTVLGEIVKLTDEIRIEILLKKLAKEFDIGYNTLEKRFQELKHERESEKLIPQQHVHLVQQKVVRKNKYEKAVEQIFYFMLCNDWVISQVEKEKLVFPNEKSRILCSEIIYYYQKFGNITVADFYTYVQDKEDILDLVNQVLAGNYRDVTTKEELFEYFHVIRDYGRCQEIKRLTNLMKKEIDPLEQAKISEKIRKLRIGE